MARNRFKLSNATVHEGAHALGAGTAACNSVRRNRRIFVLNAATEQMSGHRLTARQERLAAKSALRSMWFVDVGDLVLSPLKPSDEFRIYLAQTLGIPADSFVVSVPNGPSDTSRILNDEMLDSDACRSSLRRYLGARTDWLLEPLYHSAGIVRLADSLGLPRALGADFFGQAGADLFNRKRLFRQLAVGLGLPLAPGEIVHSARGLDAAIHRLVSQTGTVIVKADAGAGGEGNVAVSAHFEGALPGARKVVRLSADSRVMSDELWAEMTPLGEAAVVEAYLPASDFFYLEYFIGTSGRPRSVASGTIRLQRSASIDAPALDWLGLELPARNDSGLIARADRAGRRLAALAGRLGYRGALNIDFSAAAHGELIVNEINARWGGGTVLDHLGRRLLKQDDRATCCLLSRRDVLVPKFTSALDELRARGLLFDRQKGAGVVVVAYDPETSTAELLSIARERAEARRIETATLHALMPGMVNLNNEMGSAVG